MRKRFISWVLCGVFALMCVAVGIVLVHRGGSSRGAPGLPGSLSSKGQGVAPGKPLFRNTPPSQETMPPSGPVLSLVPDLCNAYRFEINQSGWVDVAAVLPFRPGEGSSASTEHILQVKAIGTLNLQFYPTPIGSWNVGAQISHMELSGQSGEATSFDTVRCPFVFQLDRKGFVLGFRFVDGLPNRSRQFLEQLIRNMQVILPPGPQQHWETRETDAAGQYLAGYDILGGIESDDLLEVEKRKLRYTSSAPAEGDLAASRPYARTVIRESMVQAVLSPQGSWVERLELNEAVERLSGDRAVGESEVWFSVSHSGNTCTLPGSLAEFQTGAATCSYMEKIYYDTDGTLDILAAKMSVRDAVNQFRSAFESDDTEQLRNGEAFVVNYLRLYPDRVSGLIGILDARHRNGLNARAERILWRLIVDAGHREAQDAMIHAVGSNDYSPATRFQALSNIHGFAYPQSSLVEGLWSIYSGQAEDGRAEPSEEMRTMAIYAVGALGAPDRRNGPLKEAIARELDAHLAGARDREDVIVTLEAVGNCGNPGLLKSVEPFFSSPDPEVRSAALEAVRRMDSPEALDTVISRYEREKDPAVRAQAVRVITGMHPTTAGLAFAREAIREHTTPDAMAALVGMLGRNLDADPENEAALRELLARNPNKETKRTVYRYISP